LPSAPFCIRLGLHLAVSPFSVSLFFLVRLSCGPSSSLSPSLTSSRGPCFFPSACVVRCVPLFLPFPFPILVLAWPAVLSAPRASLLLRPPSPSSCPPFPSPCSRLHVFPRPRRRWPALTRLSLLLRVSCYSNPSPPCRRRPPSFLCALGGPGYLFLHVWFLASLRTSFSPAFLPSVLLMSLWFFILPLRFCLRRFSCAFILTVLFMLPSVCRLRPPGAASCSQYVGNLLLFRSYYPCFFSLADCSLPPYLFICLQSASS